METLGIALLALLALTVTAAPAAAQEGNGNESLSIGQQVSLLATDNAHEVRNRVQDRAFDINMNRSENRTQVAQQRVTELHRVITDAQQERNRLVTQLQNGSITPQQFAARITSVNREIARTARSMERVENVSARAGVEVNATEGLNESLRNAVNALKNRAAANVSALDNAMQAHQLAQRARSGNFTGPEIAEFAREMGLNHSRIGPPEGVPGGPPEGARPTENQTGRGADDNGGRPSDTNGRNPNDTDRGGPNGVGGGRP